MYEAGAPRSSTAPEANGARPPRLARLPGQPDRGGRGGCCAGIGNRRVVRLLLGRGPVAAGDLADRIKEFLPGVSGADHEDRARPTAGPDEDVGRTRRRIEEVTLPQWPLLLLHDRDALTAQDQKGLLIRLRVIQGVGLPWIQHADVDPELGKLGLPLEPAAASEPSRAHPLSIRDVHDEPALTVRYQTFLGLAERSLLDLVQRNLLRD